MTLFSDGTETSSPEEDKKQEKYKLTEDDMMKCKINEEEALASKDLLQKKYDYVYQCYFKSSQLLFYFAGVTVGIIIASMMRGD